MVVRIGAFRPFRGMAVLSQLPDDRGITNAKVGVGTKLDDKRWVSDSANLLAQVERCDNYWTPRLARFAFSYPVHEKSSQTFVSAACQCPWLADNIPSPPCCCLLSRESSPHPIPAAGPPSMETPPSVTRRRPTGGMPVKPRPVCLLESSVTLPAISGVRQLPVGIPSQVVKRTHSIEVTRESSLC